MGITTKYFTNTANFKEMTEALRLENNLPEKIDNEYINQLGFSEPTDLLILNFYKELELIDEDSTPTSLLKKFRDPSTSKQAFAHGIYEAYRDLFEKDESIHLKQKEDISELMESCLHKQKSSIILNYMANTFKVLVEYVGPEVMASILEQKNSSSMNGENIGEEISNEDGSTEIYQEENATINNTGVLTIPNKEMKNTTQESPESQLMDLSTEEMPISNSDAFNRENDSDSQFDEYINKAYIKKAELLYKLEKYSEAMPALDEVYNRFADSSDEMLSEQASNALIKKMDSAEKLELEGELAPIYTEVIDRFNSSYNGKFAEHLDKAFINLPDVLLSNDQNEKALDILGKAITRFKQTESNQDFLIKAMFTKAEVLEKTGNDEEALEAIEEFLNKFERSE